MAETFHDDSIVLLAVLSILAMTGAFAVLAMRMLPAAPWWRSWGLSIGCALVGAACWFVIVPLAAPEAIAELFIPIGMMASVAGCLAPMAMRAFTPSAIATLVFAAVWSTIVFVPVSLAVFVTGVFGIRPVDHGGALVMGVATGAAAVGTLLVSGRRSHSPRTPERPWASAVAVLVLAVSWLGWLLAAELAFDEVTLVTLVNGTLCAVGGIVGWVVVQLMGHQSVSLAGAGAGLIAGLVAVSAGAPLLTTVSAISTGVLAGGAACLFTIRRILATAQPRWLLAGVLLVAGVVGTVLLGLVATDSGFLFTGQLALIQGQLLSSLVIALYSGGVSFLLWMLLGRRRAPDSDADRDA